MKAAAVERASELSWSGYEPVAVIGKEPEELAIGRTLAFEERYDDLDSMRECTFAGPSGAKFGLVRYVHAPRAAGDATARESQKSRAGHRAARRGD